MSQPEIISEIVKMIEKQIEHLKDHPHRPRFNPKPFDLPTNWAEIGEEKNVFGEERRWEAPPAAFIEWWREHRNCDLSPITAWNCECFRKQFCDEKGQYW